MTGWYSNALLLCLLYVDFISTEFCPLEAFFFSDDAICIWVTKTKENATSSTQSCDQGGGHLIAIPDDPYAGLHSFLTYSTDMFVVGSNRYWVGQNVPPTTADCFSVLSIDSHTPVLVACNESLHGICFKPLDCPQCALYIHETDTCYWVNRAMLPVWSAQSNCESENGSLAVIPTQYVMTYITDNYKYTMIDALDVSGSDGLWIGYNDCTDEDVFMTFDGQVATWFTWLDRQPNDAFQPDDQDCVVMFPKGSRTWEDKACHLPRIALCYRMFNNENNTTSSEKPPCHTATSTVPVTTPIELETTSMKTSTVTTIIGNTSDSMCPECNCSHAPLVLTPKELLEHLARLRMDTHINRKNTSAYRRRHMSVYEPRITAKCMGLTAGAVLIAVVLCLIMLDLKSCRAKTRPRLNRIAGRI